MSKNEYGWFGRYQSWEEAQKQCSGYDSQIIVERVKDALLKVKHGEAAFERDSVTFDKPEYVWPVLAALLWNAAQGGGKMNVLDFGGSLGSSYFQYERFLKNLAVNWSVVEQKIFVEYGKKYFEDERLTFYFDLQEYTTERKADVILLSSVLPYLPDPYSVLETLLQLAAPLVIFDKMPFLLEGDSDVVTIQKVPPSIYEASYPAWFFNEKKFHEFIGRKYEVVAEFTDEDSANIPSVFKGIIATLKPAT